MMENNTLINEQIDLHHKNFEMVKNEIGKVVVGQKDLIEKLLIALATGGHVLLEGYPGLAKTLTIETLAKIMDIEFKRIQFTPDLLPSDLLGSLIYNQSTGEFTPEKGPIFTNFLMADEINRAPAKVQSALLECMQEKKVTIGKNTYKLEPPFFVMATQNPIEQEGTFELPEAQKDRFMFKIDVSYPNKDEEHQILNLTANPNKQMVKTLIDRNHIDGWRATTNEIYVDDKIKKYILDIVFATREPEKANLKNLTSFIKLGASPRASINLLAASKAKALLDKRSFVVPEDIHAIAKSILTHRILLTYEAMAESTTSDDIVTEILNKIKVP
jgi:MoxR-like ATPase